MLTLHYLHFFQNLTFFAIANLLQGLRIICRYLASQHRMFNFNILQSLTTQGNP